MMYGVAKAIEALSCSIKKAFLKIRYGKRITFGKKVKFRKGFRINIGKNASLIIGDGTFLMLFVQLIVEGK